MASIMQILRRIGGAKAPPTSGAAGQLALYKAGTAAADAASLYAHDGTQWVELVDTSRNPRVITANDAVAGLRITQTGAGDALLVEDETNPDASPFVIAADGDVGVGTKSTTQAKLVVKQGVANYTLDLLGQDTSDAAEVRFITSAYTYAQASIAGVKGGGLAIKTGPSTGTAERVRIDTAGNVGIGTAAPTVKLDVLGAVGPLIRMGDGVKTATLGTAANIAYLDTSIGTMHWSFRVGGVEGIHVDGSGKVGIGGTPIVRLHVNSGALGEAARFESSGTSVLTTYHTGTTRRLTINGAAAAAQIIAGDGIPLQFGTQSLARAQILTTGDFVMMARGALGYGPGCGFTVTQLTSKATNVTLSTPTGKITTAADALAANAEVTFTVANTHVAATDVVHVMGSSEKYDIRASSPAAGSFKITIKNATTASLSEAIAINFVLIKGSIA